ncbi:MAG TPA: class I SAM-dependent methyltransferase [Oligoflexia bacterium]|nr:class I SAM-dependent methyltransferase [Oligoflexia bacterium]HMP47823.1 class I SAM-dependent methyltransferase [Oligoflexia bacterium]
MGQKYIDIKNILGIPILYTFFQKIISSEKGRKFVTENFIQFDNGLSVLDLGCGPAFALKDIKHNIIYHGIDFQDDYIVSAKMKFKKSLYPDYDFILANVEEFDYGSLNTKFDRILLIGVLHHLSDDKIDKIFKNISCLLKPDGFVFCLENTFVSDQSWFARKLIEMDRGQNVRTPEGYLYFFKKYFTEVKYEIRHDLLRVPYTHILITAK